MDIEKLFQIDALTAHIVSMQEMSSYISAKESLHQARHLALGRLERAAISIFRRRNTLGSAHI